MLELRNRKPFSRKLRYAKVTSKSGTTPTAYNWLPVVLRIQYKMIVTVFKAYCSGTPQYLADFLVKHSPVRSLKSSQDHNLLEKPKYTGERFGAKSFSVAGPRLWNKLPADLRAITSLDTFKNTLRHICFENTIIDKIKLYYYYVYCNSAHPLSYCML